MKEFLPVHYKKVFVSPQTQSQYKVLFNMEDIKICYRETSGCYRVRIQCETKERLNYILSCLIHKNQWGYIKTNDHLSLDCKKPDLKNLVADTMRAIVKYYEDKSKGLVFV